MASTNPPTASTTPPADAPPASRPLHPTVATAVTFGSSAAVLVLEITSLRLIAPYVGITMETNTAVIGLALAAIALGAWLGGVTADERPPRPLIGPLLVLGGALTMAITPAVRWFAASSDPASAAGMALVLAAICVFAPAAVLSAVPPMVVKLQLASLHETGATVGRLSAVGTVGAIVATFLTGFVLVALVPTSVILLVTGLLLVLGGVVLAWTGRGEDEVSAGTGASLVLALVAGTTGVLAPDPCDVETRYHCASVVADGDRPGGRTLVLDTLHHSHVDLEDPTYLEFGYVRTFAGLMAAAAPAGSGSDVLHVGGGAMTLPRYLLATRPESRSTVVEIDPGVIDIARDELDLPRSPRLQVEQADGRVALARTGTDSQDVYVGDAFGGVAVPWHLTTQETYAQVDRVLRPGGSAMLNLIDHGEREFLAAEVVTMQAVFAEVAVYHEADDTDGGNFVLLASQEPLDDATIDAGLAEQDSPMQRMSEAEVAELTRSAQVLTDDHAPVDQLLSQT